MNHFYLDPQFTTAEVWFDYESIYRMFVEKCPDHGHIIEVGSWKGRSSVFLAVEIIIKFIGKLVIVFHFLEQNYGTN